MIRHEGELDEQRRAQVLALADRAGAHDGIAPLSEQFLLDLSAAHGVQHLLAERAGRLLGYAQLSGAHGPDPSAELVVDPEHRRLGVGRDLATTLRSTAPAVRVWAHGDLAAARALAVADGWEPIRDLHVMDLQVPPPGSDAGGSGQAGQAELDGQAGPDMRFGPIALPEEFLVRPFEPGRDEADWLETNAAAFAHHREQGSMTVADLHAREQQPWFDPAGFLLVVPRESHRAAPGTPAIAAFHWTKIHPAGDLGPEPVGEVHVVGVHPSLQGRGLAAGVTMLGLNHLAAQGVSRIVLWVDGDNERAVRTYRRLGFEIATTDRMYAHQIGSLP